MPDSKLAANISMTGSEISYDIPANVASIMFRARGADMEFRTTSGSTEYVTIDDGTHLTFPGRTISETTFYFTGANGSVVEVLTWKGSVDPR